MDADDDAVPVRGDPFVRDPDAVSKAPPGHEFRYVRPDGPSLEVRRRRARGWSTVCAVIGVPLMSYSAYILARGTVPSNQAPDTWWIWFSFGALAAALALLTAVFLGRWSVARTVALLLMAPGLVMFVLLVWAMGLGIFFLPSALVWLPAVMLTQGMPTHERAAEWLTSESRV